MTKYNDNGVWREVIRVNWIGLPSGFVARRQNSNGCITGHLTNRDGWGKPHIAQVFPTAQEACNAAHATGARFVAILHNQRNRA